MVLATPIRWLKPWSAPTRLGISFAVGALAELALRPFWPGPLAGILAWDAAVLCFLVLTHRVIVDHSVDSMRRRAAALDAATSVIMVIVVAAACVSLYGLSISLHGPGGLLPERPALRLLLAATTVFGSWSLIHTVFAVHYAHLYYGPAAAGLIFPGKGDPNYYDFLYFSFVVGMTCQVSDVQVADPGLRRLVLVHGVLSFFFNTVILALAVSLGAGLL
jgi:uncharacterized membrane protein